MTKYKRYELYDDLRKVGTFSSLNDVFNTGLIKSNKTYFYRVFARERFYTKENICVFDKCDVGARCVWLGHQISRRARLCPDTGKLNMALTKALKDITGIEL